MASNRTRRPSIPALSLVANADYVEQLYEAARGPVEGHHHEEEANLHREKDLDNWLEIRERIIPDSLINEGSIDEKDFRTH